MALRTIAEPVSSRAGDRSSQIRSTAVRLFITCWIIYSLHVATNTVREIYLALAIADHLSFRVDEYANLHPDLFEKPGYGWHIGANPGGSMLAAVPYALTKPIVDRIVAAVNRGRQTQAAPPPYNSPWPKARWFYEEAWRRGLDVKFGLAAIIMQVLCMAPISAAGAVLMFLTLEAVLRSRRAALWLALLYAFGTPVFFRTGYLNHNMLLGHVAFAGFVLLWNPRGWAWRHETCTFLAGVCGGVCLLLDYSGVVMLLGLSIYALLHHARGDFRNPFASAVYYVAGTVGPVLLLWFYQWQSFGHFLYPGQHWMPPVDWIDRGYQGFGLPSLELLGSLALDYRYGLFTSCPLMALALASPFIRSVRYLIGRRELLSMLGLAAALWLFCGGINYTRLQFNTGIRYLAPLFPFLFFPAALVLRIIPLKVAYFIGVLAVTQAWCLAMYRDVERGYGLLEPIIHVFTEGFQLPALTTFSRFGGQYGELARTGISPLPIFALAAAVLFGVWRFFQTHDQRGGGTPSTF
jgi:hypothetical protein